MKEAAMRARRCQKKSQILFDFVFQVLQMAWHRLEHARSRVSELDRWVPQVQHGKIPSILGSQSKLQDQESACVKIHHTCAETGPSSAAAAATKPAAATESAATAGDWTSPAAATNLHLALFLINPHYIASFTLNFRHARCLLSGEMTVGERPARVWWESLFS